MYLRGSSGTPPRLQPPTLKTAALEAFLELGAGLEQLPASLASLWPGLPNPQLYFLYSFAVLVKEGLSWSLQVSGVFFFFFLERVRGTENH